MYIIIIAFEVRIAQEAERRSRDGKVVSSIPGKSGTIFFPRVKFLFGLFFGVRSIPVLPRCSLKNPGHFAKSEGGRLHLNTHAPWTQRSKWASYAVQA